jgi:hypothetical protein
MTSDSEDPEGYRIKKGIPASDGPVKNMKDSLYVTVSFKGL